MHKTLRTLFAILTLFVIGCNPVRSGVSSDKWVGEAENRVGHDARSLRSVSPFVPSDLTFLMPIPKDPSDVRLWRSLYLPLVSMDEPPQAAELGRREGDYLPSMSTFAGLIPKRHLAKVVADSYSTFDTATMSDGPFPVNGDSNGGYYQGLHHTWYVTGVRFVPCDFSKKNATERIDNSLRSGPAEDLRDFYGKHAKDCVPTIRIVAQPLLNRLAIWRDQAVHLIYTINAERVSSVVLDLDAIRQLTPKAGDKAFGVHPGFKQSYDGMEVSGYEPAKQDQPTSPEGKAYFLENIEFSELVKSFARKHATMEVLHSIEYFATKSPPAGTGRTASTAWQYASFDYNPAQGKLTQVTFPMTYEPKIRAQIVASFAPNHQSTVYPLGKSSTSKALLAGLDLVLAKGASVSLNDRLVMEAFGASYAVENPNLYNIKTMDCVSCHISYQVRRELWKRLPPAERIQFDENVYPLNLELSSKFSEIYLDRDTPIISTHNIEKMIDKNSLILNELAGGGTDKVMMENYSPIYFLRNFGYFRRWPALGTRAANEASFSVKFVNKYILPVLNLEAQRAPR